MTFALDAIPSPPAPFRTPEQYAALVAQAIANAQGQRLSCPPRPPKTECLVLLGRRTRKRRKLSQLVDAAFPGSSPAKAGPQQADLGGKAGLGRKAKR